jgi:hypothetical protein
MSGWKNFSQTRNSKKLSQQQSNPKKLHPSVTNVSFLEWKQKEMTFWEV